MTFPTSPEEILKEFNSLFIKVRFGIITVFSIMYVLAINAYHDSFLYKIIASLAYVVVISIFLIRQNCKHKKYLKYFNDMSKQYTFLVENSPETTHAKKYQQQLDAIEKGLKNNEFVLYYQVQVNTDRKIIGAEALLRWVHPEKGLVQPNSFLPLIEDHYLIIAIGEWVIKEALNQIKAWGTLGLYLPISINLGAKQLQQLDFIKKLIPLLEPYAEQVKLLKFEILETSALLDISHIIRVMTSCKELGIGFALDDFGTGYSSLSYLNIFKLDYLKIDQSFVRNLEISPNDITLCEAIIVMAHKLGMTIVAEGIETEYQAQLLFNAGCDIGQGYLFSRPVPPAQFILAFYPNL
jgi:EAL domain-containing protein (putative c-di-GMP-specific phosphodiesterase class I)